MKNKNTWSLAEWRNQIRFILDFIVDRYFGIDTRAWFIFPKERGFFKDAQSNVSFSYWLLYNYIARERFGLQDIFFDIGCGYGRALCFVARKHLTKCVGIEISEEFAEKANKNAMALHHRRTPIEIRVGDAVEMEYAEGNIFYLANPFGAKTLSAVLNRIEQTLHVHKRSIRFIYVNPVHREIFASTSWLKHTGDKRALFSPVAVSYWIYDHNAT